MARALKLPIGKTGPVQEGTKVQVGTLAVPDAGVWASTAKKGKNASPVIETSIAWPPPWPGWPPPTLAGWPPGGGHARGRGGLDEAADKEFGPFSRVSPPVDDPVVVGTAFGLDVGQKKRADRHQAGHLCAQDAGATKADSAAFLKELDAYRARMINLARQDRVRNYLEALRQAAKVVDDRKKVLQQAGPGADVVSRPDDSTGNLEGQNGTEGGHAWMHAPFAFGNDTEIRSRVRRLPTTATSAPTTTAATSARRTRGKVASTDGEPTRPIAAAQGAGSACGGRPTGSLGSMPRRWIAYLATCWNSGAAATPP